ncbi:DUF4263 domain-containing protein [Flavobacterium psychroterrae]|uniref:DUF4263 domain-containing protein n=1 Tax=Flavobacterium psychroterrae TaxID=2133767 RepID=A0ABS5PC34_9FLAO|nr:Shedu immune nuclease family protein [Flavobacterium psychroterrae]MBS7231838.1 DUF4263 domain-containing protein [Flavobacterium psychroterrae]
MKINDIIFRYSFPNNRSKDGICRIRTFITSDFKLYALITDLDTKNTSASVTNSIEAICNSLIEKLILPEHTIFIEHYESNLFGKNTFDIVTIVRNAQTEWQNINIQEVIQLIECDPNEFNTPTIANDILLTEIEKIRNQINPHLDLPQQIQSDYILRQLEIENNMISKSSLFNLIQNGAKERELLKFLKKDLSIFGEIYATPHDNYICFSEFPLNGGFVDFVMFTGYSKMDVFLIEIKGAEFNLFNKGAYDKLNSKTEIANHQIRQRLGYIHRNLSEFREKLHSIREKVVSGTSIYNSFLGPDTTTLVDKNKDINIHNVVIGGRTSNDLNESHKRHDFETNSTLPFKLESWDTFIRKLRRN